MGDRPGGRAADGAPGEVWTVAEVLAIRNRASVSYHRVMGYVDGAEDDAPDVDAVPHPTHTPAGPVDVGGLTAVVFCAACGWMLSCADGPAWGASTYRPCEPVTDPADRRPSTS